MATMQVCKPAKVDPCQKDQPKHQKITPNNEKKHHFLFWQKHGNEQAINNKPQPQKVVAPPSKDHKQVTSKPNNEVSVSQQPRSQHKIRQCFGHGSHLAGSDTEDTETIVIERKIKERVVITHARKSHDYKDGDNNKHLNRC